MACRPVALLLPCVLALACSKAPDDPAESGQADVAAAPLDEVSIRVQSQDVVYAATLEGGEALAECAIPFSAGPSACRTSWGDNLRSLRRAVAARRGTGKHRITLQRWTEVEGTPLPPISGLLEVSAADLPPLARALLLRFTRSGRQGSTWRSPDGNLTGAETSLTVDASEGFSPTIDAAGAPPPTLTVDVEVKEGAWPAPVEVTIEGERVQVEPGKIGSIRLPADVCASRWELYRDFAGGHTVSCTLSGRVETAERSLTLSAFASLAAADFVQRAAGKAEVSDRAATGTGGNVFIVYSPKESAIWGPSAVMGGDGQTRMEDVQIVDKSLLRDVSMVLLVSDFSTRDGSDCQYGGGAVLGRSAHTATYVAVDRRFGLRQLGRRTFRAPMPACPRSIYARANSDAGREIGFVSAKDVLAWARKLQAKQGK